MNVDIKLNKRNEIIYLHNHNHRQLFRSRIIYEYISRLNLKEEKRNGKNSEYENSIKTYNNEINT